MGQKTPTPGEATEEKESKKVRKLRRPAPSSRTRETPPEGRCNPARVARVGDLVRLCYGHGRIAGVLAAEWGVDRRTVRRYIKAFYDQLTEDTAPFTRHTAEQLREANEDLYIRSIASGDLKAAGGCLERLARIAGAYVDVGIRLGGNVDHSVSVTALDPDAARAELAKLRAEQGDG